MRRKLLYVCEDYVPPATTGSGVVYLACLEALAQKYDIYAIMFGDHPDHIVKATRDGLRRLCKDYLIVPAFNVSTPARLLRTLSRAVTGQIVAPYHLGEFGRSKVQSQIASFMAKHNPDLMFIHKYTCVPLLGRTLVASFPGIKVIDLHDDFVEREVIERKVLKKLFKEFGVLKNYPPYTRVRFRHQRPRFSVSATRRNELGILSMFDRILAASDIDARFYAAFFPEKVFYCPWPISICAHVIDRRLRPKFSAGFIASDAPFNLEGLMSFVGGELPRIRAKKPRFSFAVAGGISDAFSLVCPEHERIGISVMGRLENVQSFYESIAMVLVPLLNGTGVSLKTLEAASYGIPTLSTPIGVRGILSMDLPPNVRVADLAEFSEIISQFRPARLDSPSDNKISRYLSDFAKAISLTSIR